MAALFRSWMRFPSSSQLWRPAEVRVWWSSTSSNETKEVAVNQKKGEDLTEYVNPEDLVPVTSLSGVPEEQLGRVARIFMPSRNAMQSGTHNINHWKLEFETQERWENPLMGWASSADPLSNVSLTFDSKEEAIAYAVKNGWGYEVDRPLRTKTRPKSYAANFSWDKNTRIVTK